VTEVQHPSSLRGEKPRPVDHVSAILEERAHHAGVVAWIVFEIRVLKDDEVAGRGADRRAHRRPFALVPFVLDVTNPMLASRDPAKQLAGSVFGAVVHDDHLDCCYTRNTDRKNPSQELPHEVSLVVHRDQDAEPYVAEVHMTS